MYALAKLDQASAKLGRSCKLKTQPDLFQWEKNVAYYQKDIDNALLSINGEDIMHRIFFFLSSDIMHHMNNKSFPKKII